MAKENKPQTPAMGRIVLAIVKTHEDGHPVDVIRPAMIVAVHPPKTEEGPIIYIHAQVFMLADGTARNDGTLNLILKENLEYEPNADRPNTWHWPPRN